MSKDCQEDCAGRGDPRPSGLTPQAAAQMMTVLRGHAGQRSFAPRRRCKPLKGLGLPAGLRLATTQNPAARRGKIYEFMT